MATKYDQNAVDKLQLFADELSACTFIDRLPDHKRLAWWCQAFFETYFSNYIEGNEVSIDEAQDAVFQRESHDLVAGADLFSVYEIAQSLDEMLKKSHNPTDFIKLLKDRHEFIMSAHPDKTPGVFKVRANQVGGHVFVAPEHVEGSLIKGFNICRQLPAGMPRALFVHYLIAAVHPFNDGNGRLARLMMNAELVSAGQSKIIIPTAFKDDYFAALREADKHGSFSRLNVFMDLSQAYTHSVPWDELLESRQKIERDLAHLEPDEGAFALYDVAQYLARSDIKLKPGKLTGKMITENIEEVTAQASKEARRLGLPVSHRDEETGDIVITEKGVEIQRIKRTKG